MITRTYISEGQAIALLTQAVRQKGRDYLDRNGDLEDGCIYREEDGTPACIVGHVFSYLGVLDEIVDGQRAAGAPGVDREGNNDVQVVILKDFVTGKGVHLLEIAQHRQDTGSTWGEALAAVQRYYDDESDE